MAEPYLCPICRSNRTSFEIIFKLSREIRKDPETGEELFQADSMSVMLRNDRPELEVKCLTCGYTGYEGLFIKAARQGAS
ncbi:MAG: DNA alkylation repair protein [Firmicutes bacterium]|nr:DNA alkylation repair protein [Bacillota bacterium]